MYTNLGNVDVDGTVVCTTASLKYLQDTNTMNVTIHTHKYVCIDDSAKRVHVVRDLVK